MLTMHELAAWILFPLIALAILTGIGLLAERLARFEAHPALLPALGLAGAIAVLGPLFATGASGVVGCIALVALAAGGWIAGGRMRMRPRFGALAGGAAYALHIAPVVLTGHATFLGYNLLNDTAIHLALVDWIGDHGSRYIHQAPSSYGATINDYVQSRYPLGSHELLAALKPVVALDPALLYQPFLALCAGIAAAAIFAIVRGAADGRGRPDVRVAAAIAFAALASQLVFSFALQGSIKEFGFIVCLAAAAGVARSPALLALPAAALYSIYGVYALPWIVPLALIVLVWTRPPVRSALIGVAVFLVAIAVYIPDSIHYYNHGHSVITAGTELGPLAGPIKPIQAAGIWLGGDYRFVPSHSWITYLLDVIVLLLAIAGAIRNRRIAGVVAFIGPALVAYILTAPKSSPYIDAKLLAILSPAVIVAACLGLAALPMRAVAIGAAAVLGIALLISDGLAYRIALPAPTARLGELAHIDDLYAGKGPLLVNEFEEYVKHYMRRSHGSDPYETWTALHAQLRDPRLPVNAHRYDLDQMTTAFVERWPYIVLRRSPVDSRPPSNFDRVWSGRFYEVWKRARPAPLEHIPLGSPPFAATTDVNCKRIANIRNSVAWIRPTPIGVSLLNPPVGKRPLPPGWYASGRYPQMIEIHKGGSLPLTDSGAAGLHLWLRGATFRADRIGSLPVPRSLQRPWEWIDLGTTTDAKPLVFERPKRSLRPGDGQPDIVGPLIAMNARKPFLAHGRQACGLPADWIDVLP
jgi:hypothetical protein